VQPEQFTTRLQKELNSSAPSYLVHVLKKSLPYLQHSLATGELTIEGVRAPSLSQVGKLPPPSATGPSPAPVHVAASLLMGATPPPRLMGFVRPPPVQVRPPLTLSGKKKIKYVFRIRNVLWYGSASGNPYH
jgi:hypothetical protein